MREQRRLAIILAADVVGYSRLIYRDESGLGLTIPPSILARADEVIE